MDKRDEIVIVGTGAAGLFCALHLSQNKNVRMITKDVAEKSDSYLAQGGICVLRNEDDFEDYLEDTLRAGHYKNRRESVERMIRMSPEVIKELMNFGVEFERENGELLYTREGAHSISRILYHEDLTGKEITSKLLQAVRKRSNIIIEEYTTMIDLVCHENVCRGVVVEDEKGKISSYFADYVVFATGGIGGLYKHTTNFPHLTGDALAISLKYGIELEHLNYIQIHPTTLYSTKPGRRFLISESVRGEGAILLNHNMERFVDELLPRDLLTKAIRKQMEIEDSNYIWLSMQHLGSAEIKKRFPNIYKKCLEEGFDVTKDCIPVTPAQHYFMGGVKVDLDSRTSMEHLYAIGETSCNGVHGANRLASNSLLESLVFAKCAAKHIESHYEELGKLVIEERHQSIDVKKLQEQYKETVLKEIERVSNYDKSCDHEIKCG